MLQEVPKVLSPIELFAKRHGKATLFLAPMSGITDSVFRHLMREMGVHVVISDLISADGLFRNGEKTITRMDYCEEERPIGIQLFGGNEEALVEATKMVEQKGVDFVDLNLGCPVKKVVKRGGGSAWLRDPIALGNLLTKMKRATQLPLTIKIRTGWDESSINAAEIVHIAYESGCSWVAIHGRTRAQGYQGKANWELIKKVAQSSPLPIIGNGDLIDPLSIRSKLHNGYAHAMMIGRGALKNPWIFLEAAGALTDKSSFIPLIERHFALALQKTDPRRALLSLKKFLAWYSSGLLGSAAFRKALFSIQQVESLQVLAREFFSSVNPADKRIDSGAFLMGGPG